MSDRFHIFNHLCSDAFDPLSYTKLDGVDTGASEPRNAPIRRIQMTLQGMGVVPYTNLLAYQTAMLNHEAQTKWALGVNWLPDDVDLPGRFFNLFQCECCSEPMRSLDCDALPSGESSEGQSGTDCGESGSSSDDTVAVSVRALTVSGGAGGDEYSGLSADCSATESTGTSSSRGMEREVHEESSGSLNE